MAIAELIDDLYGRASAKKVYESYLRKDVLDFEIKHQQLIADFIQKTESQREPYLRRISKDSNDETKVLFLTLALIGVLRAKAVMELRDMFRTVLAPGRGNRVTTAAIYEFSNELPAVFNYDWPDESFEAMGLYGGEEDE